MIPIIIIECRFLLEANRVKKFQQASERFGEPIVWCRSQKESVFSMWSNVA